MSSSVALPGLFVVLEGIDGSGTTTHSRALVKALQERGLDARLTFEPTDGPIGSMIRRVLSHRLMVAGESGAHTFDWATMALLFAADRLDHVDTFVAPALEAGAIVISDRYDLSSLAYQSVTAPPGEDPTGWIRALNARARRPDLTLVLNVPADVAAERRRVRGTADLFDGAETQRRLAEVYRVAEQLVVGDRLIHLSTDAPFEQVAARVLDQVMTAISAPRTHPALP